MQNKTPKKTIFPVQPAGECADLIQNFDWETTSVGHPDEWPISLRNTVSLIVSSKFPMFLWWGDDLIQFYNDAYRPSLGNEGKHPVAMGQKGEDCWPEIWDFIFPLIDKVRTTGESVWYDDLLLPIYRNGRMEDVYWTFSYSPVQNDEGVITGVLVVCTETTEKIKNLKRIEEGKSQLEFAIEATELGTWELNITTGRFTANSRLKEWLSSTSASENELADAIAVIAEKDRQRVIKAINSAVTDPIGDYDIEFTIAHPITGQERILRAKGKSWRNAENETYQINGTFQDISEQKQREELFKSIIEQAPVATCLFAGRDMSIEIANDIMIGYWGKDRSVMGLPLKVGVPELIGQPFLKILDDVYSTGIAYTDKGAPVLLDLDGRMDTYYFDFTYKPLRNVDGSIYGVMNMSVDVTDQVMARQKIEENQRELLASFEESPVAIAMIAHEGYTFTMANPFYGQLVGRKPEELIGKPLLTALPELKGQGFDLLLEEVFTTGVPYIAKELTVRILRNNKMETIYIDFNYQPRLNSQQEVIGILVVAVEVTEQVVSRKKIEDSQVALHNAIELAELATWRLDSKSNIFSCSDRFKNWIGITESQCSIEDFYNAIVTERRDSVRNSLNQVLYTKSKSIYDDEYEIINQQTGAPMIIHATAQLFYDRSGNPDYMSGTAQDITKQRKVQNELESKVLERTLELQAANQNLEVNNQELRQFAYIASHDLQEPIRKISIFMEILESSLDTINAKSLTYIDRIKDSTTRMTVLIRDILGYSQLSNTNDDFERVDLRQVADEIMNEFELQIEQKNAEITFSGLATIEAKPLQMSQLFGNLISNALKYSFPDSSPRIVITGSTLPTEEKKQHSLDAAVDYIKITFKDNGIGFDPQYADKIFHIFQRLHAKTEYIGTGIGLAICKKIVQNHAGEIYATSEQFEGATFTVILPKFQR